MESDKPSGCHNTSQTAQENVSLDSVQTDIPVIDLAGLREGPTQRSSVIDKIRQACTTFGFFQVVNHGIDQTVLDRALSVTDAFFRLPEAEKLQFMSNDAHKPVRYGTLKGGVDKIQFSRIFLKTYANPLKDWIQTWPENPPTYREDMGLFSTEVQKLALELSAAITESLGLGPNYLRPKMAQGMQVIASNFYPPIPESGLTAGILPHSDHSCLTILLQSSQGLEIMDTDGSWKPVPEIKGALQIHIGDHFEVLSNGAYKSVVHRAVLSGGETAKTRISIGSFHSLGMDEVMEPAPELVDQDHPKGYKGSSVRDFLDFLGKYYGSQGKLSFLATLRIHPD